MTHRNIHLVRPLCMLAWLAAAVASSPALAAGKAATTDTEARYRRELAACESPSHIGDRQACRRDASAARANRAALTGNGNPGQYTRNALKRCDSLPEADRIDCRARMQGMGTATGTAAAGGIYRELVTVQPASPSAASATPSK